MAKDSALLYYYSMPELPENCFLQLNTQIAYRNMLMFPNHTDGRIHFEFPVFEDHSYNTICNRLPLRSLMQRPSENERYIIFRTFSEKLKKSFIIGYYRIGREFYYETKKWDNFGFVWGIESDDVHLLKKDDFEYTGPRFYRTTPNSWRNDGQSANILNGLINEISSRENIADLYKSETLRLIEIFKNPTKMEKWRECCRKCSNRKCTFNMRSKRYQNCNPTDLIAVIQHAYNSNLYSRNELLTLEKHYLQ